MNLDRALYMAAKADALRLRGLYETTVDDVLDTLVELNMLGVGESFRLKEEFELKDYEMHAWVPNTSGSEYVCPLCLEQGNGEEIGPCYGPAAARFL
jgi:hypothetical protein